MGFRQSLNKYENLSENVRLQTLQTILALSYILYYLLVVVTTSLRMTNRLLSKLKNKVSYRDYKRTQQGVPNKLLSYLYDTYMVHTNNKYSYPKVHVPYINAPCVYYEVNMLLTCILTSFFLLLLPKSRLMTLCDCSHILLYYPRKKKKI